MTDAPVADMLPGTAISSFDELATLPRHSVVLVRSTNQPDFRTAWTLSTLGGVRTWHSSSWRATPTDEDLFSMASEDIIVLYRPLEQFGVGSFRDGWLDNTAPVTVHGTLAAAVNALGTAMDTDPNAVISHRIHPGRWNLHES